jgi:hypothetical protein
MPRCNGRHVCDKINKGKVPFYHTDPTAAKRYYHIAIQCNNSSIKNSKLCQDCIDKQNNTKKADIRNNRLYDNHETVLHDTMDDPIPIWSHIENGAWFKNMIDKGYRLDEEEMVKKTFPDEKEVFAYIDTLKEVSKASIIELLMKKYNELTKTSANRYHVAYKKSKKEKTETKSEKKTEKESQKESDKKSEIVPINTLEIDIDSSKKYKINDSLKNEYTVRFVELNILTIEETNFYYDLETKEVYDLKFKKIGIYENESLTLTDTQ